MTSRRGGRDHDGDRAVVDMSRSAPAPATLAYYGEGKTMHVAAKRSMIAAAAIAAAGLFGSMPYDGASVAQQSVPTVHQEVALVDATSDALFGIEGAYNSLQDGLTVGDNGLLDVLYSAAGPELSVALFGTELPGAIYGDEGGEFLNLFNGAAAAGYNGFLSNGLALQAQLNDILGVDETLSQTFLLGQFNDFFIGDVPTGLDFPTPGDSFVADLVSIANNQYDLAGNNLVDYTEYLFTNFDDVLGGLTGADLGDLLTNLTQGLTTLTEGLTDNVNDLLDALVGLF